MTLRERKAPTTETKMSPRSPANGPAALPTDAGESTSVDDVIQGLETLRLEKNDSPSDAPPGPETQPTKLPRIILRVKEPQNS